MSEFDELSNDAKKFYEVCMNIAETESLKAAVKHCRKVKSLCSASTSCLMTDTDFNVIEEELRKNCQKKH